MQPNIYATNRTKKALFHHINLSNTNYLTNICAIMVKTTLPAFPSVLRQLTALGERLQLARKRRRITAELFSERMGVSRETLRRLENGDPTIAMGTYMRALRVLGLDGDIDGLARDDELGRKLQDLALTPTHKRSTPSKPDDGPDKPTRV